MAITGKSVQIVEMDLDVYRATQFERDNPYEDIQGWTNEWEQDTMMTCMTDEDAPSGKVAHVVAHSELVQHFWSFNRAPLIRDASAIVGFKVETTNTDFGIILRGEGDYQHELGFLCNIRDGNTVEIYHVLNDGFLLLGDATFNYSVGDLIWLRFDTINSLGLNNDNEGVTCRAKAWIGEISDEPTEFLISEDYNFSPDTNNPGKSGIWIWEGAANVYFFRVRSYLSSTEETHRYAIAADYIPNNYDAIPNVLEISQTPAQLSLGEDLGTRAQVQITFADHPHAEFGEFFRNGSYWGRFRAREIFRRGQPLRVLTGFLDQNLSDYETRHYYLDKFNGPTADDRFEITAQDLLKFLDDERAQAPRANTGYLTGPVSSADSAFSVPSGAGAQYSSSAYFTIGGKEIVGANRSGDNFTIFDRGVFGTPEEDHEAEDRVQECLIYEAKSPADILKDLFVNYAGIDEQFLDYDNWVQECNTYLQRLYTRVIAEPTGVAKLTIELIQQAGLVLWWDNINKLIKLQVLRGIITGSFEYNEENVIAESIQVEEQRDKLITEVWTYYGVRNPLDSLEEPNNYRSVAVLTNGELSSLNGSAVIKKVFGSWIPAFGSITAERTNSLYAGRFNKPPRKVMFSVPRNANIPIPREASGCQFRYHNSQDELGNDILIPVQVTRIEPLPDRVNIEAEEVAFTLFDAGDLTNRVITIDSNYLNFDLPAIHNAIYPKITQEDVDADVTLTVIINPGVIIGSASTGSEAFFVGSSFHWPNGFQITIINKGRIQGCGGHGGDVLTTNLHPDVNAVVQNGWPGGNAIRTRFPVTIDNSDGEIWAGGGGGGASFEAQLDGFGNWFYRGICGGGGGQGFEGGAGGVGGAGEGSAGEHGSANDRGDGGGATASNGVFLRGGDGGFAGDPGWNGQLTSPFGFSPPVSVRVGGAAGKAVDGDSYITWDGLGSIEGARIN